MSVHPMVPLADAAEIAAGITLGRKTKENDLVTVPYLRVANVQDGHLRLDDLKTIAATPGEIEKLTLRNGDLLLTEGGDLDKLGRGALWRDQVPLCIHQNHIFRVRLDTDRYDPEYVSFQIGSPYGKAYFLAHAKKTTGIASINQRVLGAFPVVSPPIKEQRRLADRLTVQLLEVETARRAMEVQRSEAKRLKDRALAGVFSELENWRPIGDVCKVQSGYAFKSQNFRRSGIRLLRNANILPGKVYWDESVHISAEEAANFPAYTLSAGDILISLDRPIISSGIKVARVSENDLPALLLQRVGRLLLDPHRIDPSYLYAFLQTDFFISAVSGHEQSLGVPHISPAQVEAVRIPLPDLETQRQLAMTLTAISEAWAAATAAMQRQAEDLCVLPQRLLAQAFAH